jgi:hypothetical protein
VLLTDAIAICSEGWALLAHESLYCAVLLPQIGSPGASTSHGQLVCRPDLQNSHLKHQLE